MVKGNLSLSLSEIFNVHPDGMQEYITNRIKEKHPTGEIKSIKVLEKHLDLGLDVEYEIDEQVK